MLCIFGALNGFRESFPSKILTNNTTKMKKTIISLAAIAASCAAYSQDGQFPLDSLKNPSVDYISVSASVGFESAYVFRAEKLANYSIQPEVEVGYTIAGFDLYGGAWANTPLYGTDDGLQEIDFNAGASYTYKSLRLDVGYLYYWYPSYDKASGDLSRDMEVYVGISLDTSAYLDGINLNPSVYYFYNWILEQQVVEASIGYDTPVGSWLMGWEKLTMPANVYFGYATAGRKNGDTGGDDVGCTYWYWGASIDVAYAITEYCTLSAGARYSQAFGNNADDPSYQINPRQNFWYGAKVSFGF